METSDDVDGRKRPRLVVIAAVARNGAIGGGNRLLWKLLGDLRRFKAMTLGRPIVMGRKTFESIGKPLPGRETIIVTRDRAFAAEGTHVARNIEEALAFAEARARALGVDEIFIAGGADIYTQLLERADELRITEVDLSPASADTFFPPIDPALWREIGREPQPTGDGDEAAYTFVNYVRT